MRYKIMVIDDRKEDREDIYKQFFLKTEFEVEYIWTHKMFLERRNSPFDAYFVDVFLDKADWKGINADKLLRELMSTWPRSAPVFLVSQFWGDFAALSILKGAGESSAKVVQYLAWIEFIQAIENSEAGSSRKDVLLRKLTVELDRWHGRSGFRPGPNETIRVLLLADVQFGDPKTDCSSTFAEHWIARSLKRDKLMPDLLVISGDVTHSGRPDQFALALDRFEKDLMKPLWGDNDVDNMRDRIVLVPGNHDVNLRFLASDQYAYSPETNSFSNESVPFASDDKTRYSRHCDYALEPFRRFARHLTGDRNWDDSPNLSWVDRRFLHCGLRFVVLNSVAEANIATPGRASFQEKTMREINRSVSTESPDEYFTIAVSHHGLCQAGSAGKEKQIDNWEEVGRDFFVLNGVRLWIYGHYHDFDVRSLNNKTFQQTPLWLLQLPTARVISQNRGFCLLELLRVNGVVSDAYVHQYILGKSSATKSERLRVYEKG